MAERAKKREEEKKDKERKERNSKMLRNTEAPSAKEMPTYKPSKNRKDEYALEDDLDVDAETNAERFVKFYEQKFNHPEKFKEITLEEE